MCSCRAASMFFLASSKLPPRTMTDSFSQTPLQPSSSGQKLDLPQDSFWLGSIGRPPFSVESTNNTRHESSQSVQYWPAGRRGSWHYRRVALLRHFSLLVRDEGISPSIQDHPEPAERRSNDPENCKIRKSIDLGDAALRDVRFTPARMPKWSPGAGTRKCLLQTALRRLLSKLMTRTTNPTTSSKWIRLPPTCKLKPRSHKITRTTKIVQSMSTSCAHLRAPEFWNWPRVDAECALHRWTLVLLSGKRTRPALWWHCFLQALTTFAQSIRHCCAELLSALKKRVSSPRWSGSLARRYHRPIRRFHFAALRLCSFLSTKPLWPCHLTCRFRSASSISTLENNREWSSIVVSSRRPDTKTRQQPTGARRVSQGASRSAFARITWAC